MNTTVSTPNFYIDGFSATHLIFDHSNYATIWAKCRIDGAVQEVHLVLDFALLNDLLRFSGAAGEKILHRMVDTMMLVKEPPFVLELQEVLGTQAIFTTVRLELSISHAVDAQQQSNVCYWVKNISPINIIQQAKNIAQHSQDFAGGAVLSSAVLHNSLEQLSSMYKLYIGLQELELSETACRERAQLQNDKLFAMARYAHAQQTSAL